MSKKVVIISSSLREKSNSEQLALAFSAGAKEAGNEVEFISLRGKKITYCTGCLACQRVGHCVISDDAVAIEESVMNADVVVFATPVYYYEMSGQMKTLIDRMNPLYPKDYRFRDVYLLATAAEDAEHAVEGAVKGVEGWVACFEKTQLKGVLFCGGVTLPGEIEGNEKLKNAWEMGLNV